MNKMEFDAVIQGYEKCVGSQMMVRSMCPTLPSKLYDDVLPREIEKIKEMIEMVKHENHHGDYHASIVKISRLFKLRYNIHLVNANFQDIDEDHKKIEWKLAQIYHELADMHHYVLEGISFQERVEKGAVGCRGWESITS